MNTHDMMIYVERIVRPVRATDRRKLSMRRELLAHLQAAFEEERQHAPTESAAWDSATQRLGNPAELTRSLQHAVPFLERTLLTGVPSPQWAKNCEQQMGRSMGILRMTQAQQAIFTLGAMLVAYSVFIVQGLIVRHAYQQQMFAALSEQPWQWKLGNLVSALLLLWLMAECFSLIASTAASAGRRALLKTSAWIVALMLVWQIDLVALLARQSLQFWQFLIAAGLSLLLVSALIVLGRIIRKIGVNYVPWLTLDIAD